MKAYKKKELYALKATIKGFVSEAQHIHKKEILPNTHEARYQGWSRKRSLGVYARFHQLAYAFMLGKKYSTLEKNSPLFKKYYYNQTKDFANKILGICKFYGGYRIRWYKELTSDVIVQWLKTDENIFTWSVPFKKMSFTPKKAPSAPKKTSFAKSLAERFGFKKRKVM